MVCVIAMAAVSTRHCSREYTWPCRTITISWRRHSTQMPQIQHRYVPTASSFFHIGLNNPTSWQYIPTQTPEEDYRVCMQSPGSQPTLCVAWCLIWWFVSLEKVWSYMAPNVLTETRCHETTQAGPNSTTWQEIYIVRQLRLYFFIGAEIA